MLFTGTKAPNCSLGIDRGLAALQNQSPMGGTVRRALTDGATFLTDRRYGRLVEPVGKTANSVPTVCEQL